MSAQPATPNLPQEATIVVAGNPNSGKTTLFNSLTGSRQKVGNYAGVTVEKKSGKWRVDGREIELIDLPGCYSLDPHSPEEAVAGDVIMGRRTDVSQPSAAVVVVDATNLERNLYLVLQIMETGLPVVVALNMMDLLDSYGLKIDVGALASGLGCPIVPIVARTGQGVEDLLPALANAQPQPRTWKLDPMLELAISEAAQRNGWSQRDAVANLCRPNEERPELAEFHDRFAEAGKDFFGAVISARYEWIHQITDKAVQTVKAPGRLLTDRIDGVLLHRFWGYLIFLMLMLIVFQSVFAWASYPMEWIDAGVASLSDYLSGALPPGLANDLLVEGVLGGVGAVVIFLPQILLLFFFISVLEDSGYMARAAFLIDRLMQKVGLSGKSFIPMLSSFACAIPGIMATRTIENRKDRFITILVSPLMTCSARLPVYTLLIAAFIPDIKLLGVVSLAGITMLALYLSGMAAAMIVAFLLRKTVLAGPRPTLIMELPAYRRPQASNIFRNVYNSGTHFLKRAGSIILAVSILLWFLASFPKIQQTPEMSDEVHSAQQLRQSYAGRIGRVIEPVIAPLGYDWKVGVALVGSFAAREVFVGMMGTIYNIGEADETSTPLKEAIAADVNHRTGQKLFNLPMVLGLLVFYVLACQCMATVAIVRRETNSWRWPAFLLAYTYGAAYLLALIIYQGGMRLM